MSQTQNTSTRQALLNAAVSEFWEHGYRGASVRKICTRAGASSNAITYHFGSKEKLYLEILDNFAKLQIEQADTALPQDLRSPEEFQIRLEMFVIQLLEVYLSNRESLLISLREFEQLQQNLDTETVNELIKVNHVLAGYIERAKDKGFVREDVDVDIVAGTLLDRLINQARFAHTHERYYAVTTLDPKYRAYWVRASLELLLEGMKPRA